MSMPDIRYQRTGPSHSSKKYGKFANKKGHEVIAGIYALASDGISNRYVKDTDKVIEDLFGVKKYATRVMMSTKYGQTAMNAAVTAPMIARLFDDRRVVALLKELVHMHHDIRAARDEIAKLQKKHKPVPKKLRKRLELRKMYNKGLSVIRCILGFEENGTYKNKYHALETAISRYKETRKMLKHGYDYDDLGLLGYLDDDDDEDYYEERDEYGGGYDGRRNIRSDRYGRPQYDEEQYDDDDDEDEEIRCKPGSTTARLNSVIVALNNLSDRIADIETSSGNVAAPSPLVRQTSPHRVMRDDIDFGDEEDDDDDEEYDEEEGDIIPAARSSYRTPRQTVKPTPQSNQTPDSDYNVGEMFKTIMSTIKERDARMNQLNRAVTEIGTQLLAQQDFLETLVVDDDDEAQGDTEEAMAELYKMRDTMRDSLEATTGQDLSDIPLPKLVEMYNRAHSTPSVSPEDLSSAPEV